MFRKWWLLITVYPVFRSTLKTAIFPHFLSWYAWTIRKPFSAVLVLQYALCRFRVCKAAWHKAFARLFVHAGVRFPRPFAGAIGTLFENAKLIFPPGAVETASAAIFIISGTTGLIAVKSRLLLHEQFKRPLLALCEIHSGCTSFPAGIKKRRYFLPQRVKVTRLCAYSVFNTFPVYPLSAKPLILLAFCRYRYHTSLFDRPEFERMMSDMRAGRINCIVVKDLSRLVEITLKRAIW